MKTSAADLGRTIPSFDAAGFMNLKSLSTKFMKDYKVA